MDSATAVTGLTDTRYKMEFPVSGLVVVGSVLALAACGGSTSAPSTSSLTSTLTGSVTDGIGDTVILPVIRDGVAMTPVVPVPPDLVAAAIDVAGGSLTATLSFAPGTLSAPDTFACVMLDVDENASTGNASAGGDVQLGFDYSVCAVLPRGSTSAQVSRLSGGTASAVGSVPATFLSADQVRFTVPLSLLGNDDGRVAFKVVSMQWVDDALIVNTGAIDWMPDIGLAAGLVR